MAKLLDTKILGNLYITGNLDIGESEQIFGGYNIPENIDNSCTLATLRQLYNRTEYHVVTEYEFTYSAANNNEPYLQNTSYDVANISLKPNVFYDFKNVNEKLVDPVGLGFGNHNYPQIYLTNHDNSDYYQEYLLEFSADNESFSFNSPQTLIFITDSPIIWYTSFKKFSASNTGNIYTPVRNTVSLDPMYIHQISITYVNGRYLGVINSIPAKSLSTPEPPVLDNETGILSVQNVKYADEYLVNIGLDFEEDGIIDMTTAEQKYNRSAKFDSISLDTVQREINLKDLLRKT